MNYHLFQIVNDTAGRSDLVDDVFEWSAVWLIYVLAATAAVPVLAHLRHGRAALVRVVASLGLAFAVGQAVAALSTEVRPFQTHAVHQLIPHAAGASLPSDHATAAFAVAFAVGALLSRRWGVALSVLATIIGFARVWTGVHYPGDILAGALIAAAAVATIGIVGRVYDRRTRRRLDTTA
ncbi:phosphatase PAP2 family protein [Micromonospora olivasterospora]|uniref:Undecaprenyl-diphosphatase n=1 Tax=Micromonospora olivasterospora TaxID=1880 RepID=A0A562I8T0_MICOL|nr:phosphatase PAP2 family protein [Micromonospora olivasterospora]TWH67236.1 undecaprenyl-diphosphatase [Micromonospora olivasterospora]